MYIMHSALSTSPEPLPTVTLSRVLRWLMLVPVVLLASCLVGGIAITLLQRIAPDLNPYVGISLPERILFSFSMGLATAVLLNHVWNPPISRSNWRWLTINTLAISSGVFLTTLPISGIEYCETLPLGWLMPAIGIGIGLGTVHWVYLQRQLRHAGWWILVMTSGWTLVWFLVVVSGCVLGD